MMSPPLVCFPWSPQVTSSATGLPPCIRDYRWPPSHLGGSPLCPLGCEGANPKSPSYPLLSWITLGSPVFIWVLQKLRHYDKRRPARGSAGKCLNNEGQGAGKSREILQTMMQVQHPWKGRTKEAEWGRKSLGLQLSSKIFWPGQWWVLEPKCLSEELHIPQE